MAETGDLLPLGIALQELAWIAADSRPTKFRVGRIVHLGSSRDERIMGLAFPEEERDTILAVRPRRSPRRLLPRSPPSATTEALRFHIGRRRYLVLTDTKGYRDGGT